MFRRLELIDEQGTGTVMVYATEVDALACQQPLRRYSVTAEPAEGQSRYDALMAVMVEQDPEG